MMRRRAQARLLVRDQAMGENAEERDGTEAASLVFEVSDEALEAAANAVGAIPTASIDIVPPNCC
jgi:hypothetical protein